MFPILFTIGPFNVYAFGFFLSLAFLFSTFIIWKYAKEELKEEEYLDTFFYTSITALISARATYIIFNFDKFGLNFLKYIVVRETPGLSLLGGLVGGFIFLWWYSRKKRYEFKHMLDLFSLSASSALFFTKIGEQLGGASFGRETTGILGVKIVGLPGRYHPVETYEAIFYFFLSIILFWIYKKIRVKQSPDGLLFSVFAGVAAASVFLLEFLKVYKVYLLGLGAKQLGAGVILIVVMQPLLISQLKTILGLFSSFRAHSK